MITCVIACHKINALYIGCVEIICPLCLHFLEATLLTKPHQGVDEATLLSQNEKKKKKRNLKQAFTSECTKQCVPVGPKPASLLCSKSKSVSGV